MNNTTHGTLVPSSVVKRLRPASDVMRRHSVAAAMMLLIGMQGSALMATDGSPATQASPAVQNDVVAAGNLTSIQQDTGLLGVLATEVACGALLAGAMRRRALERKVRATG